MKNRRSFPSIVVAFVLLVSPGLFAAPITVGQVDDFENATTQGWIADPFESAYPAPPANQATGGPAGTNDNFLIVTSYGGSGPGSYLNATNMTQWVGDYIADSVDAITMDVRNFGTTDLFLRLAFLEVQSGTGLVNAAYSTSALVLAAGGGWTAASFSLSALTTDSGTISGALSNTTHLQLIHQELDNPSVLFPEGVAGTLGVDNIRAVGTGGGGGGTPVPDATSTAGALSFALLGLVIARRKFRRS